MLDLGTNMTYFDFNLIPFWKVGKAMSSNETAAYKIMRMLDVNYVLVIFGGVIGYSGDDINKFLWMVRIAEGEHPGEIRVGSSFSSSNFDPILSP